MIAWLSRQFVAICGVPEINFGSPDRDGLVEKVKDEDSIFLIGNAQDHQAPAVILLLNNAPSGALVHPLVMRE